MLIRKMVLVALLSAVAGAAGAAGSRVEVAFEPDGSAEQLVLDTLASARSDIRMMAYGFSSGAVAGALVQAMKKGVKVSLIADSSNLERPSRLKTLGELRAAGAKIRILSTHKQHNKVAIIDGRTVQTGSFNYTRSTIGSNAENVVVMRIPDIARRYTREWQKLWAEGQDFVQ